VRHMRVRNETGNEQRWRRGWREEQPIGRRDGYSARLLRESAERSVTGESWGTRDTVIAFPARRTIGGVDGWSVITRLSFLSSPRPGRLLRDRDTKGRGFRGSRRRNSWFPGCHKSGLITCQECRCGVAGQAPKDKG